MYKKIASFKSLTSIVDNFWMNENLYIIYGAWKLPHKTLHAHSARCTQCIHKRLSQAETAEDSHTNEVHNNNPTPPKNFNYTYSS